MIFSINDAITCDYSGKARTGIVVEVGSDWIRVDIGKGFRCFSFDGITNLVIS